MDIARRLDRRRHVRGHAKTSVEEVSRVFGEEAKTPGYDGVVRVTDDPIAPSGIIGGSGRDCGQGDDDAPLLRLPSELLRLPSEREHERAIGDGLDVVEEPSFEDQQLSSRQLRDILR